MKAGVRRLGTADGVITAVSLGLIVVAFAGSYLRVAQWCATHGQGAFGYVIAAMPEMSTLVCILVLRTGVTGFRRAWTVLVLATSAAFTLRANLAHPRSWDDAAVAVWPAWAAIGSAVFMKLRREPTADAPPVEEPVETGEDEPQAPTGSGDGLEFPPEPPTPPTEEPTPDLSSMRGRERLEAFAAYWAAHPDLGRDALAARLNINAKTAGTYMTTIRRSRGEPAEEEAA